MGIVARQSIFNLISIGFGILLGALSTLYLYPAYLGEAFQGTVIALLAYSNLIQPFISSGLQHAVIKFYSQCESQAERDRLLWFSVCVPALLIVVVLLPMFLRYQGVFLDYLTRTNAALGRYAYMIVFIAVATAYFEVFYNWLRVQLQSVFGNFLKEFYPRLLMVILLVCYALGFLNTDQFIFWIIVGYYLRLLIVMAYSFWTYTPRFQFGVPKAWKAIVRYSLTIFLSGTAASFILDIDKSMLSNLIAVENVAYYAVALFIAAVVEMPGRAMTQIISPLVAKAIHSGAYDYLNKLLQESAINMLIISGFVFLIINSNLTSFYQMVNLAGYEAGIGVVVVVSVGKLFTMSMGCLNHILTNSKHYIYVFWFTVGAAVLAVLLNMYCIQRYGLMGAAYATLAVTVLHNSAKLIVVARLFRLQPYNLKSLYTLLLLFGVYGVVYFVPSPAAPFLSILLHSFLISVLFGIGVLYFKLSDAIEKMYRQLLKRLF